MILRRLKPYFIICSICIIFAILGKNFFLKSLANHLPKITVSVTFCKDCKILNHDFQDDIRVVATENGQVWTLSQVRRNPINESGALIDLQDLPKLHEQQELHWFSAANQLTRGTINRTHDNAPLVIYNRVPKTGSSTMQDLLWLQVNETDLFAYEQVYEYWHRANSKAEEEEMVKEWKEIQNTTVWEKHLYFIDTSRYDLEFKANWINIVRDPIDRYISEFYFLRRASRWAYQADRPPQDWFDLDLNECLETNDPNCDLNVNYLTEQQLTYFCGSAPECRTLGSVEALQRAKYNTEKFYSVVGVTEHLRISLLLLEQYLPRYFTGFLKLYGRQEFLGQAHARSGTNKKDILPSNRKILEKKLKMDMEFYEFVLQRLFNQATNTGILVA